MQWGGQEAERGLTQLERDIAERQRVVGAGRAVLPGAEEKEETDPGQVDSRPRVLVRGVRHKRWGMVKDLDGQGFTRDGGGSARAQAANMSERRESMLPAPSRRGSGRPILANAFATE